MRRSTAVNRRSLLRVIVLGVLLTGFVGCGKGLTSVEGVVNLDGKPVDRAAVSFIPEGGSGQSPSGTTGPDGKFTLTTGNDKGAPKGNYKVVVTKTEALASSGQTASNPQDMAAMMKKAMTAKPKSLLPPVYGKATSTPLTCTVPPPSQPVVFDLKSGG